jgi:hypothetical protein
MEKLLFALALLAICAVTAGWGLLMHVSYVALVPRIERWLWRRLGGSGDPPRA